MAMSRGLRRSLAGFTAVVLAVVYIPLLLVLVNSFNSDNTFGWPPPSFTLHWWKVAAESTGAREALFTSIQVALVATAIALVLGTLAAMGLRRTRFFGRNVVSLLIILPIALPGIVTGLAFKNGFHAILGLEDRAAAADPVARWVRHWEEHGFGHWCVRESGSDRIIGYAGVKRMLMQGRPVLNLVYRFAPDMWGRGFATEAASAVVPTNAYTTLSNTMVAWIRSPPPSPLLPDAAVVMVCSRYPRAA